VGPSALWRVLLAATTLTIASVAPDNVLAAPSPAGIIPLTPARLLETRTGESNFSYDDGFECIGRLEAGSVTALKVRGRAGVGVDAAAAALNVTAIFPDDPGFLTVYPCGEQRPVASNVNYVPEQAVSNAVITKIGSGGNVCIYTHAATDLVVDVNGYVPYGGSFDTLVPARLLESRTGPELTTIDGKFEGIGRLKAGHATALSVQGRGGVPDDAVAAMLNVTAVYPDGPGFVTIYPCGEQRPVASNVNHSAGQVIPNAVITQIGSGGDVCIYTHATTDLVVDVNGFLPSGTPVDTLVPARLLDTRPGLTTIDGGYQGAGPPWYGEEVTVQIAGRGGVPSDAEYAFLNVTAVNPARPGYLTVHPCAGQRPYASNVNYAGGDVRPNFVVAKLSPTGTICIFTSSATDIVVDVSGFGAYSPSTTEQLRRDLTDGTATVFGTPTFGVFVCAVPAESTQFAHPDRLTLSPAAIARDAAEMAAGESVSRSG